MGEGARRPPGGRGARGPRLFVRLGLRYPRVSKARGLPGLRPWHGLTGPSGGKGRARAAAAATRVSPRRGGAAGVSPRPHSPPGSGERDASRSLRAGGGGLPYGDRRSGLAAAGGRRLGCICAVGFSASPRRPLSVTKGAEQMARENGSCQVLCSARQGPGGCSDVRLFPSGRENKGELERVPPGSAAPAPAAHT